MSYYKKISTGEVFEVSDFEDTNFLTGEKLLQCTPIDKKSKAGLVPHDYFDNPNFERIDNNLRTIDNVVEFLKLIKQFCLTTWGFAKYLQREKDVYYREEKLLPELKKYAKETGKIKPVYSGICKFQSCESDLDLKGKLKKLKEKGSVVVECFYCCRKTRVYADDVRISLWRIVGEEEGSR